MEDLTLEIGDELMQQLQREAAAFGLSVEDYAREKLLRALSETVEPETDDSRE